jgi:hypothetical protein
MYYTTTKGAFGKVATEPPSHASLLGLACRPKRWTEGVTARLVAALQCHPSASVIFGKIYRASKMTFSAFSAYSAIAFCSCGFAALGLCDKGRSSTQRRGDHRGAKRFPLYPIQSNLDKAGPSKSRLVQGKKAHAVRGPKSGGSKFAILAILHPRLLPPRLRSGPVTASPSRSRLVQGEKRVSQTRPWVAGPVGYRSGIEATSDFGLSPRLASCYIPRVPILG